MRNRDETEIHFESNSVIHNSMSFPVRLRAFRQVKREITEVSKIVLRNNDVYVLPIEWFEQNLQI